MTEQSRKVKIENVFWIGLRLGSGWASLAINTIIRIRNSYGSVKRNLLGSVKKSVIYHIQCSVLVDGFEIFLSISPVRPTAILLNNLTFSFLICTFNKRCAVWKIFWRQVPNGNLKWYLITLLHHYWVFSSFFSASLNLL